MSAREPIALGCVMGNPLDECECGDYRNQHMGGKERNMSPNEHKVIYLAPRCMATTDDSRYWCPVGDLEDCHCDDGPHPWVKYVLAGRGKP